MTNSERNICEAEVMRNRKHKLLISLYPRSSWLDMWYHDSCIVTYKRWCRVVVPEIFQISIVSLTVIPAVAAYTTPREFFNNITFIG